MVAYSVCYPLGVLLPLLAVAFAERWFGVSYGTERISLAYRGLVETPIVNASVLVERDCEKTARELRRGEGYAVNFGRIRRCKSTSIVRDETSFRAGDLITIVGSERYDETKGSDVVVITAGKPRSPGMSRDDLVTTNEAIVGSVTNEVARRSP